MQFTAQTEQSETAQILILKEKIEDAESPVIEKLKDSLATIYSQTADDYIDDKNYKDAINRLLEAVPLYEAAGNLNALSNCYSRLGRSYYKVANYENSQLYYFNALKIEETLGNKKGIAVNLEKIGEIYLLTKDLDKASINFKQAIEIYKSLNDEKGIIYNLTNLGASNQKSGNIEEALKLYKDGLERAEKIDLKRSQSILLGNIGSSNRRIGNYQESLDYLFRALDLKLELNRFGSAAHSCSDIAETYIKLGDYKKAKTFAARGVTYARNENLNEEKFAYYLLSKINYELGEYKDSYINLNNYNRLRDSLFAVEKINRINEMQIKYETEKQQMRIAAQQSDIELLNEKNKVKNQYIVIGTFGSLTVFGFILLVRSRNREKQKKLMQTKFSRDLLISQEEERTRIAKDLHDSIGQQLTFIKRKAQNDANNELAELTNNTLNEVRSISRNLYPAMLKQLGLTASIEQLIFDFDEQTEIFITHEIDNIDDCFDEDAKLILYRFMQETLNNILKHANATEIEFKILKHDTQVYFEISDNGKGFNVTKQIKKNSLGLKTLSERIAILNGELEIYSKPSLGTKVTVKLPIVV